MATARPPAVIYTRLSRDRDGQTSTERQEVEGRALAERLGLDVVAIYAEAPGTSGYKAIARPEYDRLIRELRPGVTVIAWALDRLTRRGMEEAGRLLREVDERGGRIVTVSDGVDTATDFSDLTTGVRAILAREESKKISVRTRSAKRALRSRGRWLGGTPPHGYVKTADGRLTQDPATAPVVRRIVDAVFAGQSLVAVCRDLNADAIPSPGEHLRSVGIRVPRGADGATLTSWTPTEWTQTTLSALLRSAVLCGWAPEGRGGVAHDDDGEPIVIVDGPPIISPAERHGLQAHLEARTMTDRRNGRRIGAGRSPSALLGNLLRCGRCHGPMRPAGSSYYCEARRSGASCLGMTVVVDRIDGYVSARVLAFLAALAPEPGDTELDPRLVAVAERWTASRTPEVSASVREAEAESEDLKARLAALEDDYYIQGRIPRERFDRLHSRVTERLEGLLAALVAAEPPPLDVGPLLDLVESSDAWEAAPPALRRDVVRLVADRVTIAPVARRGERFSPDRVTIDPLDTAHL